MLSASRYIRGLPLLHSFLCPISSFPQEILQPLDHSLDVPLDHFRLIQATLLVECFESLAFSQRSDFDNRPFRANPEACLHLVEVLSIGLDGSHGRSVHAGVAYLGHFSSKKTAFFFSRDFSSWFAHFVDFVLVVVTGHRRWIARFEQNCK